MAQGDQPNWSGVGHDFYVQFVSDAPGILFFLPRHPSAVELLGVQGDPLAVEGFTEE